MKQIAFIFLGLFLALNLRAQSISEKIAKKSCICLENYKTYNQLADSLSGCVSSAAAYFMVNGSPAEQEFLKSFNGAVITLKEVFNILPSNCNHLRNLMIEENKKKLHQIVRNCIPLQVLY